MAQESVQVLVADANRVSQQVVNTMFVSLGADVVFADNGKKIIEIVKTIPVDLILMDEHVLQIEGFDVIQQIRQGQSGENNRRVPILAIFDNVKRLDTQEMRDIGIDDVFTRPIDFEMFSTKILKWVGRGKSAIERNAIDNLKKMAVGGNHNLVQKLIDLFSRETFGSVVKLRQLVENGDVVNAAKEAHHLKSSCANLGVYRMQELTEKIENQNSTVANCQLLEWVSDLENEYQMAIIELSKISTT